MSKTAAVEVASPSVSRRGRRSRCRLPNEYMYGVSMLKRDARPAPTGSFVAGMCGEAAALRQLRPITASYGQPVSVGLPIGDLQGGLEPHMRHDGVESWPMADVNWTQCIGSLVTWRSRSGSWSPSALMARDMNFVPNSIKTKIFSISSYPFLFKALSLKKVAESALAAKNHAPHTASAHACLLRPELRRYAAC